MDRRGWAGQIVDAVDLSHDGHGDVVLSQREGGTIQELRDVTSRASMEVVHAENLVVRLQQAGAKVRADEAGTTGDQDARARHSRFPEGWR